MILLFGFSAWGGGTVGNYSWRGTDLSFSRGYRDDRWSHPSPPPEVAMANWDHGISELEAEALTLRTPWSPLVFHWCSVITGSGWRGGWNRQEEMTEQEYCRLATELTQQHLALGRPGQTGRYQACFQPPNCTFSLSVSFTSKPQLLINKK